MKRICHMNLLKCLKEKSTPLSLYISNLLPYICFTVSVEYIFEDCSQGISNCSLSYYKSAGWFQGYSHISCAQLHELPWAHWWINEWEAKVSLSIYCTHLNCVKYMYILYIYIYIHIYYIYILYISYM